jgi:hypothetical protein
MKTAYRDETVRPPKNNCTATRNKGELHIPDRNRKLCSEVWVAKELLQADEVTEVR